MLDMARPKNKKSTIWPSMRVRDAARKSTLKGEHFEGIHDRFLRDPVYRESQLAIGWSEQKCKEWDELAKEDHTYNLTPEEKKKTPRTMVSYLEQTRQKWAYETSI